MRQLLESKYVIPRDRVISCYVETNGQWLIYMMGDDLANGHMTVTWCKHSSPWWPISPQAGERSGVGASEVKGQYRGGGHVIWSWGQVMVEALPHAYWSLPCPGPGTRGTLPPPPPSRAWHPLCPPPRARDPLTPINCSPCTPRARNWDTPPPHDVFLLSHDVVQWAELCEGCPHGLLDGGGGMNFGLPGQEGKWTVGPQGLSFKEQLCQLPVKILLFYITLLCAKLHWTDNLQNPDTNIDCMDQT